MNKNLISTMMANPYVFFEKFVVEALPAALFAYGLVWLVMRPKDGRYVPSPFLWHLYGVIAAVVSGAVFRTIAMVTFAGRVAYEPEAAAAGFYLMIVPASVATAYVAVRLRSLAEEQSPASDVPIALNVFVAWVKRHIFWVMVAGSMVLLLQAYQDKVKGRVTLARPESTSPTTQPVLDLSEFQTPPQSKPSQIDEFLKDAPKAPNYFDKYDTPATTAQVETAETQEHYRQIYAAHPDADEIAKSPAFQAWVAHYPVYQGFLVTGSAQEIVGMFTAYKNQR